jgi:hypothetical protein
MSRYDQLMPNGIPKYLRIYDNGGETFDRYTIVFTRKRFNGEFVIIGASGEPCHPQGFYQHCNAEQLPDRPVYSHLGKPIEFIDLPHDLKIAVQSEYAALWGIEDEFQWRIEVTDTFGGQANYSWVKRDEFDMPESATDVSIIRRAKEIAGYSGVPHRKEELPDGFALYLRGAHIVIFVTQDI